MNERIKLLALESGMRTTHLHYGRKDPYVLWEDDIQKFAELIVRECADICYNREYANGSAYGDAIMEDFGVKE